MRNLSLSKLKSTERWAPGIKPTRVCLIPRPSYYHAFSLGKNERKMGTVPRRWNAREWGYLVELHFQCWPSEAFTASSVLLVAEINWTSTFVHKRVKSSRNGWAKPEWIAHSNRIAFLMKASLLVVQRKLLVKCITRAITTPIPVPMVSQTPIVSNASTFKSVRLCRETSEIEITLAFSCAVWIWTIQWAYLSHCHLINKTELVIPTSRTVARLNEMVYMNAFCYLWQYRVLTAIILNSHFCLFLGNKNNLKVIKLLVAPAN